MATWLSDVIQALNDLGGLSHYSDIYKRVEELRSDELPKSWQAIIRRTIETNSSDSEAHGELNDFFYSVDGLGKGIWGLRNYVPKPNNIDLTEDDISFPEGKLALRLHVLKERNPKVVIEAKKRFKLKNLSLYCEICGFNFENKYGNLGKDYIEAHHVIPVSELKGYSETNVMDLVMVCSNCHVMLHRKRPWLTKEQLQELISKGKK